MTSHALLLGGPVVTSAATVLATTRGWESTGFAAIGASLGVLYAMRQLTAEDWRPTIRRLILGGLGGVVTPRLFLFLGGKHHWFAWFPEFFADPLLIILIGFLSAWFWYWIVDAVLEYFTSRRKNIGKTAGDALIRGTTKVLEVKEQPKDPEP